SAPIRRSTSPRRSSSGSGSTPAASCPRIRSAVRSGARATKAMTAPAFERTPPASGPLVQGFAGRCFGIDGTVYQGVLLTPERALAWEAPPLTELTLACVE